MPGVVIITGASSGFGKCSAETLAQRGYKVYATMRDIADRNRIACAALRAEAKQNEFDLSVLEMDVRSEESICRTVKEIASVAGRIDVVVNNAGFGTIGMTEAYSVQQFQQVFDTNFFGAVRVNRAVLPIMRRQRSGLLIHVSSPGGRIPVPFTGAYCASKCALEALADAYCFELRPLGIDSVVVEPAFSPTSIQQNSIVPDDPCRAEEYEIVVECLGRVRRIFNDSVTSPAAIQPEVFADSIIKLIETPSGERPFRTLIGQRVEFLKKYNDLAFELRSICAERLQVRELLQAPRGQKLAADASG